MQEGEIWVRVDLCVCVYFLDLYFCIKILQPLGYMRASFSKSNSTLISGEICAGCLETDGSAGEGSDM